MTQSNVIQQLNSHLLLFRKHSLAVIKNLTGSLLLFVVLSLTSCHNLLEPELPQGNGGAQLLFSFSEVSPSSRATVPATEAERKLSTIGLMFYTEAGAYTANTVSTVLSSGGMTGLATFVIPAEVKATKGKYKILVFTNGSLDFSSGGKDIKSYMDNHTKESYDVMKSIMHLKFNDHIKPNLSFSGETALTYSGVESDQATLSTTFKRTVAKIELQNKAANKLYIEWAKVANFRSQGYLYQDGVPSESAIMPNVAGIDGSAATEDVEIGTQFSQKIGSGLYAFPNIVPHSAQDDKFTTCLIIAGRYKAEGWGVTVPSEADLEAVAISYYRANIHAEAGEAQILGRNKRYNIIITGVNGEGDPDEDDAIKNTDNKLEFETDDWDDSEDGGIVTDPDGTYMRVVPLTMLFQPLEGDVQTGAVFMSEGGEWNATISKGSEYFEIVEDPSDDRTVLRVQTKVVGDQYATHLGEIEIRGKRKDGKLSNFLYQKVSLIQYTNNMEFAMLSVDGKQEDFTEEAPGNGAILRYRVITGSQLNSWVAVSDNNIASWATVKPPKGGNGSIFEIDVHPNSTGSRSGKVTIHFDKNGDGTADDPNGANPDVPASIKITISQALSTSDITIFPAYSAEHPLITDGFSAEISAASANGSSQVLPITVYTVDGTKYPKYIAELDAAHRDAAIVGHTVTTYPPSNAALVQDRGLGLKLLVKRTAPGDPDIECNIKITPADASGIKVEGSRSFTIPITIYTSAVLASAYLTPEAEAAGETIESTVDGHVWLWTGAVRSLSKMYVYDRNAETATIESAPVAKNFTLEVAHPDFANKDWQGGKWTWGQAVANAKVVDGGSIKAYQAGWILPDHSTSHMALISQHIIYSKKRVIVLSDGRSSSGAHVGCFLPLSYTTTLGYYWSSTVYSTSAYLLSVGSGSAGVTNDRQSLGYSVRPVRIVTL